jgi:hypothetical protein
MFWLGTGIEIDGLSEVMYVDEVFVCDVPSLHVTPLSKTW